MQQKQRPLLPSEHELEELLESIKEKEEISSVGYRDDVFSFLTFFNIEPGEQTVPKRTVYALYSKWSECPLNTIQFNMKMGAYFEHHFKGTKPFWKINLNSLQINESLIRFLERSKLDKTKYPSWKKHFEDYLCHYQIKDGRRWVQPFVLKHFYDKWCFENKRRTLLSETQFFNFCKLYFPYRRTTDSRMQWFGINEEFMNTVSVQTLRNLQRAWNKKNAKKPKSKNKIPSTKAGAKS
jgi:hypothetical protein